MQIFNKLSDWQAFRKTLKGTALSIGFAPTMGNLHQGHVSLFQKSVAENDLSVSSLFINPTQFNQAEDFKAYPRTLERDLEMLQSSGIDYCLLPETEEIYADQYRYQVMENQLSLLMEGEHRPGHFNGVLTVVLKLFNLVQPNNVYFGEKDYQQYLLIDNMCKAFFLDIKVVPCPTVREPSMLACSSRNNRLTEAERKKADKFAEIFHHNASIETTITSLEAENIAVDYIFDYAGRRFAAVVIGAVRLIDNFEID